MLNVGKKLKTNYLEKLVVNKKQMTKYKINIKKVYGLFMI